MHSNGVVHEWGDDNLLQKEPTILKSKMRLQMGMGRRGLLPKDRHLFSQRWNNLWGLPGKDKKLWLREVTAARKCGKRIRDRETGGGQLSRQRKMVHGAPNT